MTSDERNREAISEFSAPHIGRSLELYLKNKAWEDDSDGETCVYLVKDSDGDIALFFSIKCGLLYEKTNYEKLEGEELDYVDMVIEAKLKNDNDAVRSAYDLGEYMFDEGVVDKLFKIADERINMKKEKRRLKETDSTLRAGSIRSYHDQAGL